MAFSIPLYFLLIPYAIFLGIFMFFAGFNLVHFVKEGIHEAHSTAVLLAFIAIVLFALLATLWFGLQIDWLQTFDFDLTGLTS
ncbi:MAG: hypothetical protein V1821_02480 [bacterium]